jgi:hypothetical protein
MTDWGRVLGLHCGLHIILQRTVLEIHTGWQGLTGLGVWQLGFQSELSADAQILGKTAVLGKSK